MGKNRDAKECVNCGNLIYYGGKCNCMGEPTDANFEEWELRMEAECHVKDVWTKVLINNSNSIKDQEIESALDVEHNLEFLDSIWYASTNILPHLEVSVIIDAKNDCYVSTGSASLVAFTELPVGAKIPLKCWIHTHPFGSAYFSHTDWTTISGVGPILETAYVLGSEISSAGHYGFWNQRNSSKLEVYYNGVHTHTQNKGATVKKEEE